MEFEWDPLKDAQTQRRRGFGFADVIRIFNGRVDHYPDTRRDYGEERIRAIGEANGHVYAVVYTVRGNAVRIISARRANRRERQLWQSRD